MLFVRSCLTLGRPLTLDGHHKYDASGGAPQRLWMAEGNDKYYYNKDDISATNNYYSI
jgi:hypothetical protein